MTGIEEVSGAIAIAAAAVSTGVGIYASQQNAQAQARQAAYQAAVANNNAIIARQNAAAASQAGQAKAEEVGLRDRAVAAQVIAAQAANDIDVNTGSNVDVRKTQRITGLEDVAQTEHNAFLQAYGYQTQASNFEASAGLDTQAAKNATALSGLSALSTAAGGLSSIASKYTDLSQKGVFGGSSGGASSDTENP